jgi:hypothetical protein
MSEYINLENDLEDQISNIDLDDDYSDNGIVTTIIEPKQEIKRSAESKKHLSDMIKTFELIAIDATNSKNKYQLKYDSIFNNNIIAKRNAPVKKEKIVFNIKRSYLDEKYQPLFASNLDEMELSNLENIIKAYFFKGILKKDISYLDIAITKDEFDIHCEAYENDPTINCINDKDIPILIRRMFKKIDTCKAVTKSGKDKSIQYKEFTDNPVAKILMMLQDMKLISYENTTSTTNIGYKRAEVLPELLDQIPLFKMHMLRETNMEKFGTIDTLTKLLFTLQDSLNIYNTKVESKPADDIVDNLVLPLVYFNDKKYFKNERVLVQMKVIKAGTVNYPALSKDINVNISRLTNEVTESSNLDD